MQNITDLITQQENLEVLANNKADLLSAVIQKYGEKHLRNKIDIIILAIKELLPETSCPVNITCHLIRENDKTLINTYTPWPFQKLSHVLANVNILGLKLKIHIEKPLP